MRPEGPGVGPGPRGACPRCGTTSSWRTSPTSRTATWADLPTDLVLEGEAQLTEVCVLCFTEAFPPAGEEAMEQDHGGVPTYWPAGHRWKELIIRAIIGMRLWPLRDYPLTFPRVELRSLMRRWLRSQRRRGWLGRDRS